MSFQLGRKVLIVNDPAQAELLFYAKLASGIKNLVETDDDFQGVAPFDELATSPDTQDAEGTTFSPAKTATAELIAQADFLRINGFVELIGADVLEVTGAKAVLEQKEVSTLTFTVTAPVAGTEVVIDLNFKSDDFRGEFASHSSDYKRKRSLVIKVEAGETATTFAAKVVADIKAQIDTPQTPWVTATSAAGVVTLTAGDGRTSIKAVVIPAGGVSAVHAVTSAQYSGRGTYEQLKGVRLESNYGTYVESSKSDQVPLKGAKYSQYIIKKRVTREDLAGLAGALNSIQTGDFEFVIYVNESASAYILDLTKWLNANVAKRTMYTSTTAAGVVGGDPTTAQTVVDSTAPFTTNLV